MKPKVFEVILKSLNTNPFNCSAIDLSQALLEDKDLLAFTEALKGNANIHSIDLSHNPKLTEKSLIPFLNGIAVLKALSILKLKSLSWNEASLNVLGNAVGGNQSLKILELSDNVFTETSLKGLGKGLTHNTSLEALYLQNCALGKVTKVLVPFLSSCPKGLQKLVLAQNQLNSTVMSWLQPTLALFTRLGELDISNNIELGSAGAESIAEAALDLPHLTTLNLNEVALEGGLEAFFTALKERPNLHSLSLAGNRLGMSDAFALQRQLPRYPGLRQLNLGNNPLIEGDGSFRFAEALAKLPYLQELNLSDTGCTINLHALMEQLRQIRQLARLDISHEKLGSSYSMNLTQLGALLQALPHCPNLRWLNLSFTGLSKEAGIAIGQALAHQAGLESLELKGNPLGNQGVQELLKGLQQHPTLQRLGLAKTGLSLLAEAVFRVPLKNLDLSENELRQESALTLGRLLEITTSLQQLDLSYTTLGKQGIIGFIQSLTRNTTLQLLNISHAPLEMETALLLKNAFINHPTLRGVILNGNPVLPSLLEEFEVLNAQKQPSHQISYKGITGEGIYVDLIGTSSATAMSLEGSISSGAFLFQPISQTTRGGKEEFKAMEGVYPQPQFNERTTRGQTIEVTMEAESSTLTTRLERLAMGYNSPSAGLPISTSASLLYQQEKAKSDNNANYLPGTREEITDNNNANYNPRTAYEIKLKASYYYVDISNFGNEAKQWFQGAKEGNAVAQYNLGCCYYRGTHGVGTSPDYKGAVFWYEHAANQGDVEAQNILGYCYKRGDRGVAQDIQKAMEWFSLAANQGYEVAQFNLASCYQEIAGTHQEPKRTENYKQAVHWYKEATNRNHSEAPYYLGLCHEKGWGVLPNFELAKHYYMQAKSLGYDKDKVQARIGKLALLKESATLNIAATINMAEPINEAGNIDETMNRSKKRNRLE